MIDKAITFATKAHEGQFRKGTKLPYSGGDCKG